MRKTLWIRPVLGIALSMSALAGVAAPLAPGSQDRPADRAEILAHIDSVFQAFIHKDRDKVRSTHAPEWRGFLSNTRTITRGIDAYMAEAEGSLSNPRGMIGYRMKDVDVVFYGDVAVVPYIAEIDVDLGAATVTALLRVLDVYAELDGHWTQVASNTGLHPDTQAEYRQLPRPLSPPQRRELLAAREAVWRAWFANDRDELAAAVPEETLAINAGETEWEDRDAVLASAARFAESGAKLSRLDFPRTEIQTYGDLAVLYSLYEYDLEAGGRLETHSGRGTEVFVHRGGRWVNAGWHLDAGGGESSPPAPAE